MRLWSELGVEGLNSGKIASAVMEDQGDVICKIWKYSITTQTGLIDYSRKQDRYVGIGTLPIMLSSMEIFDEAIELTLS